MKHFTLGNFNVRRVLLAVAVAMAAVFVPQNAQADEYYGLQVAGVKVTDQNCDDLSVIDGVSGTVWYDEYSNALYMKDAKIEAKDGKPGILAEKPLEVACGFEDTVFTAGAPCIVFEKGGRLSSPDVEGSLLCMASGGYAAIVVGDTLEINETNVWAFGKYGIAGKGSDAGLYVLRSGLELFGTECAMSNVAGYKSEAVRMVSPEGAAFDAGLRGMAKDGKLVSDTLFIAPVQSFTIFIVNNDSTYYVNEENCGDLSVFDCVEGKADYDWETRTLTLDNAKIDGTLVIAENGVNIVVKGRNEIRNTSSSGASIKGCCLFVGLADTVSICGVKGGELKLTGDYEQKESSVFMVLLGGAYADCDISIKDCNLEINGFIPIGLGATGSSRPLDRNAASLFAAPLAAEGKALRSAGDNYRTLWIDNSNVKLNCGPDGTPIALAWGDVKLARCRIVSPENATFKAPCFYLGDGNILQAPLVIESESTPVGVGSVKTDAGTAGSGIYTIEGVKLNTAAENLPAGLYIMDGKKIMKK